jgi:hypothetical protein
MTAELLDTGEFLRALLDRGWLRSDADPNLLVHPMDHTLCLRYDPSTDRFTVSPELDAQLAHIIPTPASRGRFWRSSSPG